MQKELQLALLVIGGIFIIGILVHGFWTTRRQRNREAHNRFESKRDVEPKFNSDSVDELDDEVVGTARVISGKQAFAFEDKNELPSDAEQIADEVNENISKTTSFSDEESSQKSTVSDQELSLSDVPGQDALASFLPSDSDTNKESDEDESPDSGQLYADVVTQPKPEFTKEKETELQVSPEPPAFLLKQDATEDEIVSDEKVSMLQNEKDAERESKAETPIKSAEVLVLREVEKDEPQSLANQAKRMVRRKGKSLADKLRREPTIGKAKSVDDDQMRIDFGESNPGGGTDDIKDSGVNSSVSGNDSQPEQDVVILNVQTPKDLPISGAALLQMLLTLGFKFGEHDIFHRHVNTNGKGPVLFSLTNLFKPGVFNIDDMENFSTQGLSLFMMLPIEGEAQQVFNMMHNAARKIADEFGGRVLDANKVPISKQSLQQYAERIRDFERRQKSR